VPRGFNLAGWFSVIRPTRPDTSSCRVVKLLIGPYSQPGPADRERTWPAPVAISCTSD